MGLPGHAFLICSLQPAPPLPMPGLAPRFTGSEGMANYLLSATLSGMPFWLPRQDAREVKGFALKANAVSARRFEPCS